MFCKMFVNLGKLTAKPQVAKLSIMSKPCDVIVIKTFDYLNFSKLISRIYLFEITYNLF